MRSGSFVRGAGILIALKALVTPALAHHVMDGKLPQTFMDGMLSGLGHPVIGPDHLAFIIAIGIAAALVPAGVGLIGAFIAASTAGVLVHLGAVDLPMSEALVAGSVILAGALVAAGRSASSGRWLALAVLAGLAHGYAFGESIVGAEQTVLGAYLVGIALVAGVIAVGLMTVTKALVIPSDRSVVQLRTAGAVLACVGLVMLAGSLVVVPA